MTICCFCFVKYIMLVAPVAKSNESLAFTYGNSEETMRRIAGSGVIAALLVVSGPTLADEAVTRQDRFELWNNCQPVRPIVAIWDAETRKYV